MHTCKFRNPTGALLFAIIMLATVVFRFAALGRIPPGVSCDEALNGIEGIQAQQTHHYRLFYPTNNGREGLWINLIGVSESVFGVNEVGLRFPAAVTGSLTVLFVYLLAKELYSEGVALFAAWFLATSFWHVAFSRMGLRAIATPLFLAAAVYCLIKLLQEGQAERHRVLLAIIGGIIYGVGFHTYIAYRFTPLVILVLAACSLRNARSDSLRRMTLPLGLWVGSVVLAALPLGIYFLLHQHDFFLRASQVSVFGREHPAHALWNGIIGALTQYNIRGDRSWASGIRFAPLLLPPIGILFLAGVALALRGVIRGNRRGPNLFLLAWLIIMLLPAILAGEPSGIRSLGTIPPVFIFAAVGAHLIYARLRAKRRLVLIFVAAIFAIGLLEGYRYFYIWAREPRTADALSAQQIAIGRFLKTLATGTPRYVAVDRDDDEIRIPYKNGDGSELPLPVTAETTLFAAGAAEPPAFLFEDEVGHRHLAPGSIIVQLYYSPEFDSELQNQGVHFRTGVGSQGVHYVVVE
jgi:4-amino-4-deoxy-L-arabinose transferase-like glycosyltransferase